MAHSILDQPHFNDADKAREYLERLRWPSGPICPHCGSVEKHYALEGPSTRSGLYKCSDCREQFTVTVGTVFERSKVPLNKWLLAVHLMCASKKAMSSHQLHRMLGVTYKTAWFLCHRIREAMDGAAPTDPLGGPGRVSPRCGHRCGAPGPPGRSRCARRTGDPHWPPTRRSPAGWRS